MGRTMLRGCVVALCLALAAPAVAAETKSGGDTSPPPLGEGGRSCPHAPPTEKPPATS